MKKFLMAMVLCLMCTFGFGQTAQYGKLTYECGYGFYFDCVSNNDSVSQLFMGANLQDAQCTIDGFIDMFRVTEGTTVERYSDRKCGQWLIIKQDGQMVPFRKPYDDNPRIMYIVPYGQSKCEWYILECELYEIQRMLNEFGK